MVDSRLWTMDYLTIDYTMKTPKELGFHFPAEFAKHTATWLSWPHKEASWPGKIETIYPRYAEFIKRVAEGERVNINVVNDAMIHKATHLNEAGADSDQHSVFRFILPTMRGVAITGRHF
jgi:agmatine deiminase